MEKIKIGIPRALFFYYYYPFCKTFFEEIGLKVILSDKTNNEILSSGLKESINELCLPIKVLFGHINNLKDKVDYIFLPYILTTDGKSFLCPKLIASPDIIKANIPNINIINVDVDMRNLYGSLYSSFKELVLTLGFNFNPIKLYFAYKKAIEYQKKFDSLISIGYLFDDAIDIVYNSKKIKKIKNDNISIAIIAHPYLLHDLYLIGNIPKKLESLNIRIYHSDMLSEKIINKELKNLDKIPHWTLGNRIIGSALHFSKIKKILGIIYLTPFGCSSDSIIKEYMIGLINNQKPLMTITFDEHSADAGTITRLEAFIDMIKRKKNGKD
jgi:predicted nucleotide-binding protein (sugar kinase/HSP70/actin superfamily)